MGNFRVLRYWVDGVEYTTSCVISSSDDIRAASCTSNELELLTVTFAPESGSQPVGDQLNACTLVA